MSIWQVVYTEQAERDLRSIYEYIAFSLIAPEGAKNQLGSIMEAIAKLNQMPYRCSLYEKEPWQSKGLRVLPVGNYLFFYLPVESRETVVVIRIMYGGRSITEQLGLGYRVRGKPLPLMSCLLKGNPLTLSGRKGLFLLLVCLPTYTQPKALSGIEELGRS